jgi:hypothetical protein
MPPKAIMNATDRPAIRTWLCQQLGVHAITLSILPGATSARWASSTAALTEREALILRTLEPTNILAPQLVARHKNNGVLMSILPGAVKLPVRPGDRWLGSLARELGRIHATDAPLPWQYPTSDRIRRGGNLDFPPLRLCSCVGVCSSLSASRLQVSDLEFSDHF